MKKKVILALMAAAAIFLFAACETKKEQGAPSFTYAWESSNTIVITAAAPAGDNSGEFEYSKDDGSSWQDSNIFYGVSDKNVYKLTVRMKETLTYLASDNAPTQTTTVNRAQQSLVISAVSAKTFGDAPFEVATTGGSGSGAVTITVKSGPATVSGSTVTLTGAGNVVIYATKAGGSDYDPAVSADYTINVAKANQAAVTITNPLNHTYSAGLNITLAAAGGSGTGAYSYALVSGNASLSGAVLTVTGTGNIVVTATKAADANYNAASATYTLVISKGDQAALTIGAITSKVYGDEFRLTSSGGTGSGAVSYVVVSGTAEVFNTDYLRITGGSGTVSVKAVKAADDNYRAAESSPVTFSIGKANQAALSFTNATTDTFAPGKTIALNTSGGTGSGAVTYAVTSGNATVSGSTLTLTGAGAVVVTATKAGGANYIDATATLNLTVNRAEQAAVTFTNPQGVTYIAGLTITLTATGGTGSGAYSYALVNGNGIATLSGAVLTVTGTGNIIVTATRAGDSNYNAKTSDQYTITVGKAEQAALSFTTPNTATYSAGLSIPLAVTGGSGTGAVTYSVLSGKGSLSGNNLVLSGAGNVEVSATKAADSIYAAKTAYITIMVARGNGTASVSIADWTYGAAASTPTPVSATNGTGSVAYSYKIAGSNDSTYTTSVPTAAGDYTLRAVFAANDDYNAVSVTADFAVNAKSISGVTISSINDIGYGETGWNDPAFTVTDGVVGLTKGTDYSVAVSATSAGLATVTITGMGNYTGTASTEYTVLAKVNFYKNGGTGTEGTVYVEPGSILTEIDNIPEFEKEFYTFIYWSTSTDGLEFGGEITSNETSLYAIFTKTITSVVVESVSSSYSVAAGSVFDYNTYKNSFTARVTLTDYNGNISTADVLTGVTFAIADGVPTVSFNFGNADVAAADYSMAVAGINYVATAAELSAALAITNTNVLTLIAAGSYTLPGTVVDSEKVLAGIGSSKSEITFTGSADNGQGLINFKQKVTLENIKITAKDTNNYSVKFAAVDGRTIANVYIRNSELDGGKGVVIDYVKRTDIVKSTVSVDKDWNAVTIGITNTYVNSDYVTGFASAAYIIESVINGGKWGAIGLMHCVGNTSTVTVDNGSVIGGKATDGTDNAFIYINEYDKNENVITAPGYSEYFFIPKLTKVDLRYYKATYQQFIYNVGDEMKFANIVEAVGGKPAVPETTPVGIYTWFKNAEMTELFDFNEAITAIGEPVTVYGASNTAAFAGADGTVTYGFAAGTKFSEIAKPQAAAVTYKTAIGWTLDGTSLVEADYVLQDGDSFAAYYVDTISSITGVANLSAAAKELIKPGEIFNLGGFQTALTGSTVTLTFTKWDGTSYKVTVDEGIVFSLTTFTYTVTFSDPLTAQTVITVVDYAELDIVSTTAGFKAAAANAKPLMFLSDDVDADGIIVANPKVIVGLSEIWQINVGTSNTNNGRSQIAFNADITLQNIELYSAAVDPDFGYVVAKIGSDKTDWDETVNPEQHSDIVVRLAKAYLYNVQIIGGKGLDIYGVDSITLDTFTATPAAGAKCVAVSVSGASNVNIVDSVLGAGTWGSLGVMYQPFYAMGSTVTIDDTTTYTGTIYNEGFAVGGEVSYGDCITIDGKTRYYIGKYSEVVREFYHALPYQLKQATFYLMDQGVKSLYAEDGAIIGTPIANLSGAWYTDEGMTQPFVNTTALTADIKLYGAASVFVNDAASMIAAVNNAASENIKLVLGQDIVQIADLRIAANKDIKIIIDLAGFSTACELDFKNYVDNVAFYDMEVTVIDSVGGGQLGNGIDNSYGIYAIGKTSEGKKLTVNLDGIKSVGYYGGLYTNGGSTMTGTTTINAVNCEFSGMSTGIGAESSVGVYLASNYFYNFTGCTFNGSTGYYAKSGTHTLTGCTVNGAGDYYAPNHFGNGAESTGSAMVVDSSAGGYVNTLNVNVYGGAFNSQNGYAIEECRTGAIAAAYSTVFVRGNVAYTYGADKEAVRSQNSTVFLVNSNKITAPGKAGAALFNDIKAHGKVTSFAGPIEFSLDYLNGDTIELTTLTMFKITRNGAAFNEAGAILAGLDSNGNIYNIMGLDLGELGYSYCARWGSKDGSTWTKQLTPAEVSGVTQLGYIPDNFTSYNLGFAFVTFDAGDYVITCDILDANTLAVLGSASYSCTIA